MCKKVMAATVFFLLGSGTMILACENTHPDPEASDPYPMENAAPVYGVAPAAQAGYALAGAGAGGTLLAGAAVLALRKRS